VQPHRPRSAAVAEGRFVESVRAIELAVANDDAAGIDDGPLERLRAFAPLAREIPRDALGVAREIPRDALGVEPLHAGSRSCVQQIARALAPYPIVSVIELFELRSVVGEVRELVHDSVWLD
jgi:hypothetical protein